MSSRLRILVFLLLAPLPAVPSFAAPWMPLGPFGGTIFSLTVAPSDPHRLYAVTGEGLFRSTNGGASWTAIRGDSTSNVAVDPTRPDTIYVGTESGGEAGGGQKSTDGGAHWTALPLNTFAVLAGGGGPAPAPPRSPRARTQGGWG